MNFDKKKMPKSLYMVRYKFRNSIHISITKYDVDFMVIGLYHIKRY
jgi:hypothetical protein